VPPGPSPLGTGESDFSHENWMPHPCAARVGNHNQVLREARTLTKNGCPRCLALGHLGNYAARNASRREATKIAQGESPGKSPPNHPPPRRGGTALTKKKAEASAPANFADNYPASAHNQPMLSLHHRAERQKAKTGRTIPPPPPRGRKGQGKSYALTRSSNVRVGPAWFTV
jgi:hypothetical protein